MRDLAFGRARGGACCSVTAGVLIVVARDPGSLPLGCDVACVFVVATEALVAAAIALCIVICWP